MFDRHTLYDAEAQGGAAAVETPPEDGEDANAGGAAPPAPAPMPIAGGIPPKPAVPPAPDVGKPPKPGFDWKGKIPDDAPPAVKKYKTWEEYGSAHGSLQAALEKAQKAKAGPPITRDQWRTSMAEYIANGALPEEQMAKMSEALDLPIEYVADFFATAKQKRDSFVAAADADLAPSNVTYSDLEGWLHEQSQSDSPVFSRDMIDAFGALANSGNTNWLKDVLAEYQKAKGDETPDQTSSVPASRKAPPRSGKPAGYLHHEGFKTRAEYRLAMASAGTNPVEKQKVIAKLERTPLAVRNAWGPR